MPDIMHRIKIPEPPERIYQALTTADGIRNWWTRDADIDSNVGGTGEFRFYGRRFVAKVKIDELIEPARVGWSVVNAAWDGNVIQFDVEADGGGAWLSFRPSRIQAGGPELRCSYDPMGLLPRQPATLSADRTGNAQPRRY
jgi:uncharacterized protein YndB with AHSA1/START domain